MRRLRADGSPQAELRSRHVIGVAVLGFAALFTASFGFTGSPGFPGGDEPHYLILAQSLWRDHDLRIENNHERDDYREYFDRPLRPHYLARGVDGEIYSVHPIGLAVILAPVYALGGYTAVVIALTACGGVAAAAAWAALRRDYRFRAGAWMAWAAVALSAPFVANSATVYPEIVAALCVIVAFSLAPAASTPRWAAAGVAAAMLPWLSTKYAPLSLTLALICIGRAVFTNAPNAAAAPGRVRWRRVVLIVAPCVASLTAWLLFFWWIWGGPSPSAPYGGMTQTRLRHALVGAPGLLFDQEYGALPYAPALALAIPGLYLLLRSGGPSRRCAIEVSAAFLALLVTVGAFRIWWGGDAAPGRPIASGLLLLAWPIAFFVANASTFGRSIAPALVGAGVVVSAAVTSIRDGVLLVQGRDGSSTLLQWLSPDWPLHETAPSYIRDGALPATMLALVWVGVPAAALWVVRTFNAARPGGSAAPADLSVLGALTAGALVTAVAAGSGAFRDRAVAGPPPRARIDLLDRYDPDRRPLAIRYTPFRVAQPRTLLGDLSFEGRPDQRRSPAPTPLLFNARFALPAGRYRLETDFAPDAAPVRIALQVGLGDPWTSWDASPDANDRWSVEFDLPASANLVGLLDGEGLDDAIRRFRIVPVAIDPQNRRFPEVMRVAEYGDLRILVVDDSIWTEKEGFWTRAGHTGRIVLHAPAAAAFVLQMHCGPIHNVVRLSSTGWTRRLELAPGQSVMVDAPGAGHRGTVLSIETEAGFSPSSIDASTPDSRQLGCWISPRTVPAR
jgi:hypothetical protein